MSRQTLSFNQVLGRIEDDDGHAESTDASFSSAISQTSTPVRQTRGLISGIGTPQAEANKPARQTIRPLITPRTDTPPTEANAQLLKETLSKKADRHQHENAIVL